MEELNVPDISRRGRGRFHNVNVNVNGRVVPRLYSSEELSVLFLDMYNALVMIYDLTDHGDGRGQLWQDRHMPPIINDCNVAIEYGYILGRYYTLGDIYDVRDNIRRLQTIRQWFVDEVQRRLAGGSISDQGVDLSLFK